MLHPTPEHLYRLGPDTPPVGLEAAAFALAPLDIFAVWCRLGEFPTALQTDCRIGGECQWLVGSNDRRGIKYWDETWQTVNFQRQWDALKAAGLPTNLSMGARVPAHPPAYNKTWTTGANPPTKQQWQDDARRVVQMAPDWVTLQNEEYQATEYVVAVVDWVQPIFDAAGIPTLSEAGRSTWREIHLELRPEWSLAETERRLRSILSVPNQVLGEYWLHQALSTYTEDGAERWMLPIRLSAEYGKPLVHPFLVCERNTRFGGSRYNTGAVEPGGRENLAGAKLREFLAKNGDPMSGATINDLLVLLGTGGAEGKPAVIDLANRLDAFDNDGDESEATKNLKALRRDLRQRNRDVAGPPDLPAEPPPPKDEASRHQQAAATLRTLAGPGVGVQFAWYGGKLYVERRDSSGKQQDGPHQNTLDAAVAATHRWQPISTAQPTSLEDGASMVRLEEWAHGSGGRRNLALRFEQPGGRQVFVDSWTSIGGAQHGAKFPTIVEAAADFFGWV